MGADRVGCSHLEVVGPPGELGGDDLGRMAADLDRRRPSAAGCTDREAGAEHTVQDADDAGVGECGHPARGATLVECGQHVLPDGRQGRSREVVTRVDR